MFIGRAIPSVGDMSKVIGDKWMGRGGVAGDTEVTVAWQANTQPCFQLSSPSVLPTDPRTVKPLFQHMMGKE